MVLSWATKTRRRWDSVNLLAIRKRALKKFNFSHWCEQGDNLDKYGWLKHDGSNFGIQEIVDGPFTLTTSFVKQLGGSHGGDWTARISVDYLVSIL